MRRCLASLVALALAVSVAVAGAADAKVDKKKYPPPVAGPGCQSRVLVLSAMPVELSAVLARYAALDPGMKLAGETVAGHDYYVGRFLRDSIVVTMTGIGPANAKRVTDAAFDAFRCGRSSAIREVVFSGVAGGDYIGSVVVPDRWLYEFPHGVGFSRVDSRMLAAAKHVAASVSPLLRTTAPAGDPACGCVTSPDAVTTVAVTHRPTVEVGGRGLTTDPFSGRALPCVPGGGDVFGCTPCAAQTDATRDGAAFAPGVVPFADPAFFTGYFASSTNNPSNVAADEESGAVAQEAILRGARFIAFRAVSDGGGDPLGLPGFPAQFFFYRQLAADNAAIVTLAFLATGA